MRKARKSSHQACHVCASRLMSSWVCFLSPAAWRNLACIRVDRSGNTRPACIHTVCTDRLVVELSDSNLLPTGTVPRAQHWLAGSTNEQSKRRANGSAGCRSSRTGRPGGQPSRSREALPYRWPNMSLDDSAVQRRSLSLAAGIESDRETPGRGSAQPAGAWTTRTRRGIRPVRLLGPRFGPWLRPRDAVQPSQPR